MLRMWKNYFFNRANMTCILDEGIFKNCKFTNYLGDRCDECKNDFYLNKTDCLCYNNLDKNGNFYKCLKTDNLGEFWDRYIEGYYLGSKDKKCNKNYGCILSEDEIWCSECNEYYCLNKKIGKYEDNEEIPKEDKIFYYKLNITNKEGTRCKICVNGFSLDNDGICRDTLCIEKNEDGTCKKCQKFESDKIDSVICLNNMLGCVEIYQNDKCLECNNILDFYNCTKCEEGYEIDIYGYCKEIE